jgi:hypothetical protein
MKKLLLILTLILTLNISATPVKNESYLKNIVYTDSLYNGNHFRMNYDTNEIFLNIKNFENKTFKFKRFETMRASGCIISWTTAICDNENYDVDLIYDNNTKSTYYIFKNKKTGFKIKYYFI